MAPALYDSSVNDGRPSVVVLSLASDFGCQIQLSNFPQLLETLSTIDLKYWQLVTGGEMPEKYDIAIIEGAVTTSEHFELLKQVRDTAKIVISIGACAAIGGIPAMASADLAKCVHAVYGNSAGDIATSRTGPASVSSVVEVDYTIPGCPINPHEFSQILQGALLGVQERPDREPLCGHCKIIEVPCFYGLQAMEASASGKITTSPCLGLVTRTGCGAYCVERGRPCTGCRGIAEDANLLSARKFVVEKGRSIEEFDAALKIYNSAYLMQFLQQPKQESVQKESA